MAKIIIPLDYQTYYCTDSLDTGDEKGHTPQVSIAIKQSAKDKNGKDLEDAILGIPKPRDQKKIKASCGLVDDTKHQIKSIYAFETCYINDVVLNVNGWFGMYLEEAIGGTHDGRVFLRFGKTKMKSQESKYPIDNEEIFDAISDFVGNRPYGISAFVCDTDKKEISFRVDIYGNRSERLKYDNIFVKGKNVFKKKARYNNYSDVSDLSDSEFSFLCIRLIKEFESFENLDLLENERFCEKHFGLKHAIICESVAEGDENLYTQDRVRLEDNEFHIIINWNVSDAYNSRENFYDWLQGQKEFCLKKLQNEVIDLKNQFIVLEYRKPVNEDDLEIIIELPKRVVREKCMEIMDEVILVNTKSKSIIGNCIYRIIQISNKDAKNRVTQIIQLSKVMLLNEDKIDDLLERVDE